VADAQVISFRPLARDDLPALTTWLNAPHVYAWWGEISGREWLGGPGDGAATLAMVEADYLPSIDGRDPTEHFVIVFGGEPIGMVQWYRLSDELDYARDMSESPDGAAALDLLIGDPSCVDRGLGPKVIDAFVRTVMFAAPDVQRAVTSPDVRNTRSIRAFEKAGFRAVRDALVDDGHHTERVMVRDREEQPGRRER
jgi:aminoglycoside 6'-N-acetyltransferase